MGTSNTSKHYSNTSKTLPNNTMLSLPRMCILSGMLLACRASGSYQPRVGDFVVYKGIIHWVTGQMSDGKWDLTSLSRDGEGKAVFSDGKPGLQKSEAVKKELRLFISP